jgi:predicted GTPase
MRVRKVIIMGAAGRDFHNFNVFFRNNRQYRVVCFTATQIPNIDERRYPPALAGRAYPRGIPIHPESELKQLIQKFNIDVVVFSYSDIAHTYVMHKASEVIAAGADFWLMGMRSSILRSKRPVISVCAVRTGCGKSQTTRRICDILHRKGIRFSVIRHPMPYGDLKKQIVQKYSTLKDLDKYNCTIEEREEYEPHILRGNPIFAGVDYGKILMQAEKISDVIVWDGGNNDLPFYSPDLHIVVADPFRVGHETTYHPGEANLRLACAVIINKAKTAPRKNVDMLRRNITEVNPSAVIMEASSPITIDKPELIRNKRVIIIEDGPTLTHGGMSFGAGVVAAKKYRVKKIVDPRRYAVGSIKSAYNKFKHLDNVVPALGYGEKQMKELERSINKTPADAIVIATPVDLRKFMKLDKPAVKVDYELKIIKGPKLETLLKKHLRI